MTAFGLTPKFRTKQGWFTWKRQWKDLVGTLDGDVRSLKRKLRSTQDVAERATLQRELVYARRMVCKAHGLLKEGKERRDYLLRIKKEHEENVAQWPLDVGACRNVDFHFNKKYLEFDFLPMWIVKAKGKTFYVNHVDCQVPWSTKEQPENASTKGAIRIKRGDITIDADGVCTISAPSQA